MPKMLEKGPVLHVIGAMKLKCEICHNIYSSYIVRLNDWKRVPLKYRKSPICLNCYKKLTKHNPEIVLKGKE